MYANRDQEFWSPVKPSFTPQKSPMLEVLALMEEVTLEQAVSSKDKTTGSILRIRTDVAQILDPKDGCPRYFKTVHIGQIPRADIDADDMLNITSHVIQARNVFLSGGDHGITVEWIYVGERNSHPWNGEPSFMNPAYLDLRQQPL